MKPRGVVLSNEEGLLIVDWYDGHQCELRLVDLRAACPCALCSLGEPREEMSSVTESQSRELMQISQVGNYALQLFWMDGHASGIYNWELLRNLCRCARSLSGEAGE
jgi:DUF971 family protein